MFDEIVFPENLSELTSEQLAELRTAARTAISAFTAGDRSKITVDAIAEAEQVQASIELVEAEITARAELASRLDSLQTFSEVAEAEVEEVEEEAVVEDEAEVEAEEDEAAVEDAADENDNSGESAESEEAPVDTQALAGRRPAAIPGAPARTVSMHAATDVPGYNSGAEISDFEHLAAAMLDKWNNMPAPAGSGEGVDWRKFGLASIDKNIPEEFHVPEHASPEQALAIMEHAANADKVFGTGKSLVASGGWCTPSEVVYDLCVGETTDGIYTIPEVVVPRGGLKFTMGPDWSDIYGSAGFFAQTEAQAISGTTKASFEVTCPSWTDVRLDVVGFFLKAPVLTNAAYPELISRWLRGYLVAHQWKKAARRLSAIQTALGSAVDVTALIAGATSYSGSLLYVLEFLATAERSKRRWSKTQPFEVILPEESLIDLRTDLGLRTGKPIAAVTDQMVLQEFAVRNLVPTFVRGWNDIDTATAYAPAATTPFMLFKAGTFVEGTSNVLNLSTMYDAASLSTNIYTAAFFEEGQSIMKMCYGGVYGSVASVCLNGRTGAADLTCS